MDRLLVPTMPMRVDPNPRGSATKHVTMAGDNPFEREVLAVRGANAPLMVTNSMLPGMGLGDTPGGTASSSFDMNQVWGGLTKLATEAGSLLIQKELGPKPVQQLPTQQSAQIPGPQIVQIPAQNPNIVMQMPDQQSNLPKMMPWIIGGVAILAVGGIMLAKRRR